MTTKTTDDKLPIESVRKILAAIQKSASEKQEEVAFVNIKRRKPQIDTHTTISFDSASTTRPKPAPQPQSQSQPKPRDDIYSYAHLQSFLNDALKNYLKKESESEKPESTPTPAPEPKADFAQTTLYLDNLIQEHCPKFYSATKVSVNELLDESYFIMFLKLLEHTYCEEIDDKLNGNLTSPPPKEVLFAKSNLKYTLSYLANLKHELAPALTEIIKPENAASFKIYAETLLK